MDPQLLAALLSQAKGGNKNLSGTLGNMDNPILLALAQVLDPYYGTGQTTSGAGSLYGSFASDETTPAAVKAVMDYVDQGMNGYQIEAQINSLDPDIVKNSGYTDEQLISMGKEMAKEGGKKGADVFAKAGLRNPNDIYDVEDVPLNDSQNKDYMDYLGKAKESKKGEEMANWRLAVARHQMEQFKQGKEYSNDMVGEAQKMLAPSDVVGEAQKMLTSSDIVKRAQETLTPSDVVGQAQKMLAPSDMIAMGKKTLTSSDVVGEGQAMLSGKNQKNKKGRPSREQMDAMSRAQAGVADVNTQVQADLMRAQAVREGALMRAQSQGRTPFTDQTSALLKFIAGSK